ncbi:asparagine synthase (glutamine-hydrolyzing) [Streptomyces sp. MZ04]|uniref:asparagine synthase (glutamine-hydrolyzing) n=1 Tax=Streptomyces sp. MZ04 TaxID=2559236 RepID=UPI00107EC1B4|nr:asparagine synthase (glutamine-hydrolyzing) [Streptomyces sp. MZ04]TGB15143.1 asparagine synthase (glutamine-hydrolyzing) [Streptomyces sp. MZ04]
MCGIAGMVSFTSELTERLELVDKLSEPLTLRGPNEAGHWTGRHALIAFRRNAVIDLDGGRQPMVAADASGSDIAVLAYTGEIFNTDELRNELSARGHRFRDHSDTAVVLHSYLEWGEHCAERLRGMFAFTVWDERAGRLVLIRDRFGIYPLCYAEVTDGLAFASEPKALFAAGACRPVVGQDGLRELLAFTPTPGDTVFRGVSEVVPGQVVTYDRTGLRRRTYWRLEVREHTDDYETTVRTVRELLEDAVRTQLVADVPLGLMLSGGLDSSALCAIAAKSGGSRRSAHLDGSADDTLRTYSMEYGYHFDHFRPDEQFPALDSPYAHLMSRHLGSDHRELVLGAADAADPARQLGVVAAMDRPTARLDMYVAAQRLSASVRETSKVAVSGDGADELFGGYRWFRDPARAASGAFPWFGPGHRIDEFGDLLDRGLLKDLDLSGYSTERYTAALAEVPRLDADVAVDRRMRELTYLHMTRYVRVTLDRKDRMGASVALEGRVPFCDHPLVEYVFNVPSSMKTAGGWEKSLLRAAVADLLPAEVRDRKKSPFPKVQDPAYDEALRVRLRELTRDSVSPVAALLDPARVDSVLSGTDEPGISRLSIEMAIGLDLWVRELGVTIAA